MPPTEEEKRLIETLYTISIDDIRQLKNRQWDVTKWVLAANVALLIPIAIKPVEGVLPSLIVAAIVLVGGALWILAWATVLKTQASLAGTRTRQKKWRDEHSELAAAYGKGGEKQNHTSFFYDFWVWFPMLAISATASLSTIMGALGIWLRN
jgi:hypothetical protein